MKKNIIKSYLKKITIKACFINYPIYCFFTKVTCDDLDLD